MNEKANYPNKNKIELLLAFRRKATNKKLLMNKVKYDFGFMFKYSERPGTLAARKFDDNVPEEVKQRRLSEIIDLQLKHSFENLSNYINKYSNVLIEKESKKSSQFWCGRNSQNIMVVFPKKS